MQQLTAGLAHNTFVYCWRKKRLGSWCGFFFVILPRHTNSAAAGTTFVLLFMLVAVVEPVQLAFVADAAALPADDIDVWRFRAVLYSY